MRRALLHETPEPRACWRPAADSGVSTLVHLALLDPGAFRALEILVGALTFSWLNRRRNSRIVGVVEDYAIAAAALIGTFVGGGSLDSLIAGAVLGFFACLSGALALMRRRKVAPGPN